MNRCIFATLTGMMALVATACTNLRALPQADAPSATGSSPSSAPTPVVWFPATGTATSEPRPTVQPTADKKPGVGDIVLSDDFSSPADWNTAVADQASVAVTDRGLTIAAQPGIAPIASFRQGRVFSDMYLEVTARPSLCRGPDVYGLVFRAPNNVAYYRYAVACDGTASANRISLGLPRVLQPATPSADVPVGAPGEVRLGVWARHDEFRFFLNGRYQFAATDVSYPSGGIGVFAHAAGDTPVTVTFSALSVYSLESALPVPSAKP
jgi:hypothetical protein